MKTDLKSAMEKRTAVKPVSLYQPEKKSTKPQVDKTTNGQVVKYTTHLPENLIKAVKHYALNKGVKDYYVVKEALELFLSKKGENNV